MPRSFLSLIIVLAWSLSWFYLADQTIAAEEKLNLLIITVDDMSADSLGVFGCQIPGTSPNIDKLATQSLRFSHAHVQVGNCMPSRNVMWSGRYSHNNGVEGFYQVKAPKYPVLSGLMQRAGYFTAIRHKVSHSTPYHPYPAWDLVLDTLPDGTKAHVKDAQSYGVSTKRGIAAAQDANKPFCLLINIADPHKPFFAQGKRGETVPDEHLPTRVFSAEEITVPGFLFDDPVVRKELAHYYSSVRRADDAVGHIMSALEESKEADNTLVMFLSDHGMALPFAKTQLYHHSTHTPLMIRWPNVTKPGTIDTTHMVSAVDFLPTLLAATGLQLPKNLDGRSFVAVIKNQPQQHGWDHVIKEYNENVAGSRDPMRAVQTKKMLYLFNPWSNGERVMATATTGTPTYRRMAELAQIDQRIAARHALYQHRVVEELFDIQNDPDCLINLIDSSAHQSELNRLRGLLEASMVASGDHILSVFRRRHDAKGREDYVITKEKEAMARRANRRGRGNRNRQGGNQPRLISFQVPKNVSKGAPLVVKIRHQLTADQGEQLLHVTLKDAAGKRVERQIITISTKGVATVTFKVPATLSGNTVQLAAFIGKDFNSNLQHITTNKLPLVQ
jgi:N-sulfoglucosamine sulfohydrolase